MKPDCRDNAISEETLAVPPRPSPLDLGGYLHKINDDLLFNSLEDVLKLTP